MTIETARGVFPAGSWSYSSWRPPHLAGVVDHIWTYSGPTSHRRKRVFPNGRVELLINFGDPYRILDGRGADHCRIAWLGGPQVGPLLVHQPVRQDVMGVRLLPAGAYALLARPMRDVAGLSVDLADLIGPAAGELAERCDAAGSVAARFRIVAAWIAGRLAQNRGMDEAIAWAVSRLDDSGGTVPIREVRAHVGMSKARLAGLFREQVGLTPKLYAPRRALSSDARHAPGGRAGKADRRGPRGALLRPAAHERRVPRPRRAHAERVPRGPAPRRRRQHGKRRSARELILS